MSQLRDAIEGDDVAFANQFLDEKLDRLDRGLTPLYAAQTEMAKALVTLASASLIFSVSMIQFLAPRLANPHAPVLLPWSWGLFALTVVAGAISHPWGGKARGIRLAAESMRGEMLTMVRNLDESPDSAQRFLDDFDDLWKKSSAGTLRAITVTDVLSAVAFWSYVGGLVCLLIFGVRNLPF